MNLDSHPELLRSVIADRHEALRRDAALARLRREALVVSRQRRRRQAERRRLRRHPLVAPPPAPAD